jgi:hypothetical protein
MSLKPRRVSFGSRLNYSFWGLVDKNKLTHLKGTREGRTKEKSEAMDVTRQQQLVHLDDIARDLEGDDRHWSSRPWSGRFVRAF